ncbi:MAG: substrate-binding domain-containing protein, partial [Methanogenium sp.]|nr:substrate-binding domain-containing protein [Methanogenium sp.]
MKKLLTIFMVMLVAITGCMICGCTEQVGENTPSVSDDSTNTLLVYCGAGLRDPMDEIAEVFRQKEGISVDYIYGGSAQLLSQMELVKQGDAYMPGAKSYIDSAAEKGFISKSEKTVYHVLGIIVPKGNPKNIQCLDDLTKEGVRVAIGEPSGPAVGKAA